MRIKHAAHRSAMASTPGIEFCRGLFDMPTLQEQQVHAPGTAALKKLLQVDMTGPD
jgi:hypothetical protein